jgi:imidazolonepropionase-like amidohydrolase
LAVVGHIPENVSINKLLNSGVKLIAHGEEFYPAFEDSQDFELTAQNLAKQVKQAGVAVTPNSAFIRRMIDQLEDLPKVLEDPKVKNLAPRVIRWWNPRYNFYTTRDEPAKFLEQTKRKYKWLMIFVRELHKAGVPLLTGTDASIPGALPGYSMMEEFKDLETAGLSAAEILRTATINSARFILDNTPTNIRFGEIREGYRADLVLLDQNPLEKTSALDQSIVGVVFNGRWAKKESLRKLLDEKVEKFDR